MTEAAASEPQVGEDLAAPAKAKATKPPPRPKVQYKDITLNDRDGKVKAIHFCYLGRALDNGASLDIEISKRVARMFAA